MSSPSSPQHEPTMEEILASIRKIISEDQPEPPMPAPPPGPVRAAMASPPQKPPPADVLELTEEVQEDGTVAPVSRAEPPIEEDIAFETIEPEPKPEPESAPDELISDSTRSAVGRALANLEREAPSRPAGETLEALFTRAVQEALKPTLEDWIAAHRAEIMDHLRPMIRQWMDENLPRLIEAAVARELGRAGASRFRRF